MPVSSIYYLDTLAYLDFKFSVREAPFLKSVVTILPFTILYICGKFFLDPFETFWVISDKTQFFGSFQTKLFFYVFEAKNQLFSEKVQKRAKKIF